MQRTVIAGKICEIKKMFIGRTHIEGQGRSKNSTRTKEIQQKMNEKKREENLRWILNANFEARDSHVVLHYCDKSVSLEQCEVDKKEFLRLLRRHCKKHGIAWKYVACTETKRMSNIHHHIVLPKELDVDLLAGTWEKVTGERRGNISIRPLDRRGDHRKLASYLMKESKSTSERFVQMGAHYKRFSTAQGMVRPKPEYRIISAASWDSEPRARKNWILLKDDNGDTVRTGFNPVTRTPWLEYVQLWTGEGEPSVSSYGRKLRRGGKRRRE